MGLGEEARAGAFAPKEPDPAPKEPDPPVLSDDAADQQRIAEFNAHPHTQLNALLMDLRTPRHDIHDRLGALHNGLTRLAQLVLQHTPAPENPNG